MRGQKKSRKRTALLTRAALLCALLVVSTLWIKFSIPGTEILVTTQVFFVLLCGYLLPPRYCFLCLGAYLAMGLIGLPVFSAVCGPAVLATPSFGYLLGFPFAAALTAWLAPRLSRLRLGYLLAGLAGVVTYYAVALPYVALLKGVYLGAPLPVSTLLSAYCFAFLPLDIGKAILAALLGKRLAKIL